MLAAIAGTAGVVWWFVPRHDLAPRTLLGTGIEVGSVLERLRRVRVDYSTAIPGRAPNERHRRELLERAALSLRQTRYFQELGRPPSDGQ
jgi:hypothetical protein